MIIENPGLQCLLQEPFKNIPLVVILGSPQEAWKAAKLMVSHNDFVPLPVESGTDDFVVAVVGYQLLYKDGFAAASKLQVIDLSGTGGSLQENPAFSSLSELQ